MISVVIPYFQRQPGILAKALKSVFETQGIDHLCIIVVDDASPVPATAELALVGTTRFPVTIIEQDNMGPGGARNTGLNQLSPDTEYVAFLDSDDEWSPLHLKNALTALRAGYDVYFSDHLQLGAEISAFRRAGRIIPTERESIAGQDDLHVFRGDIFDQILSGNVIGTSTVVFDRRKFPEVRFRTELRMAGEDYLFWLDLSLKGGRFAFGSTTEVVYGKGVNVFAGSGWGTENHALRIFDELVFRQLLLTEYPLADHQRRHVITGIAGLRDAFVRDFFHRLTHSKRIDWQLISSAVRREPKIICRILPIMATKIIRFRQDVA